jgi:hypothetical protein
MTKFISIDKDTQEKKETVFTHYVENKKEVSKVTTEIPGDWDNVMFIGKDYSYGDVFKCWNNLETDFFIIFGTKGDEFN